MQNNERSLIFLKMGKRLSEITVTEGQKRN